MFARIEISHLLFSTEWKKLSSIITPPTAAGILIALGTIAGIEYMLRRDAVDDEITIIPAPLIKTTISTEFEKMLANIGYPLDEVPSRYCCPISRTIMNDPVFAMDGHTYDRHCIAQWFLNNNKSPLENLPLISQELIPNKDKKSEIVDFIQKQQKKYYGAIKQVFFARAQELELKNTSDELAGLLRSYLG